MALFTASILLRILDTIVVAPEPISNGMDIELPEKWLATNAMKKEEEVDWIILSAL